MSRQGIVFYLHMHQPFRIRQYSIFDTANSHDYFNDSEYISDRNNQQVFKKVADKSYRPMLDLLVDSAKKHADFKVSLSITGTFLEQAEAWAPDLIDKIAELVGLGQAEIVAETYQHSLAFFYSKEEFERQVDEHCAKIERLFGYKPTALRNTELAYNDDLAKWADQKGFRAILAEGWEPVLDWRSPNFVYKPANTNQIALLLKNYRLSDDIAFRFGNKQWPEYPLTAGKYIKWVEASLGNQQIINLFMDFETFGEHQWEDTGIFSFFAQFIDEWLAFGDRTFYTISETVDTFKPSGEISMPHTVTWADTERDLTAWLGNSMQHEAMRHLYSLETDILRTQDAGLIADWRKLQTSDHMYYMCTKWFSDGDVHAYFSPYESPYEAFLYFMNAIRDVRWRLYQYHNTGALDG